MLEGLVEVLGDLLAHPVYSGILLILMGLANNFFPPVPIEVATVFAGYLTTKGYGSLPLIALSAAGGTAAGSCALFFLIRREGELILRLPLLARLSAPATRARMARWLDRYGIAAFFGSKLVPGMYFASVAASALAGMNPARAVTGFIISNLLAFGGLVLLGAGTGRHWRAAYKALGGAGLAVAGIVGAAVLIWWLVRRARLRAADQDALPHARIPGSPRPPARRR